MRRAYFSGAIASCCALFTVAGGCGTQPGLGPAGPKAPEPGGDTLLDEHGPPYEPKPPMVVYAINVGQGAATLVEFSCGAILVDTGGEYGGGFDGVANLVNFLETFFSRRPDLDRTLDAVYITHPHDDHARGGPDVWKRFRVKNVITDGLTSGSGASAQLELEQDSEAAHVQVRHIMAADVPAGGLTDAVIDPVACADVDPDIRVLWGQATRDETGWGMDTLDNPNNNSVVVRVGYGKASLLITGDLETPGIRQLLAKHAGTDILDVDVYEAGHHGSSNGTNAKMLNAMTPEVALIAAGSPDRTQGRSAYRYGHPAKKTVELLAGRLPGSRPSKKVRVGDGARKFVTYLLTKPVYSTAWDGDVQLTIGADGAMSVTTESP